MFVPLWLSSLSFRFEASNEHSIRHFSVRTLHKSNTHGKFRQWSSQRTQSTKRTTISNICLSLYFFPGKSKRRTFFIWRLCAIGTLHKSITQWMIRTNKTPKEHGPSVLETAETFIWKLLSTRTLHKSITQWRIGTWRCSKWTWFLGLGFQPGSHKTNRKIFPGWFKYTWKIQTMELPTNAINQVYNYK
jgi:hypothetical protein